MKLQTSGVLGTSYAIAKLAPKREKLGEKMFIHKPEVITNGKYDISIIVTTDKKSLKIKLTKK